ncbi:MAG TPA: glycosyltransferase N-terminal domain-containing protein [Spirochaetota bacterium]|nr:glycosyltransferase N-terminal domain-containing protein [Spirochaetota bacterium]
MLFLFYNILVSLYFTGYLLISPLLFLAATFKKKIYNRLGFIKSKNRPILIHAVSGGEVILLDRLLPLWPSKKIHITTMSDSGYLMLQQKYKQNPGITFSFLPLDFYPVMSAFIRKLKPQKIIIIEHDLWPNMLHIATCKNIKKILLNAALKPADLKSYRLFPPVARLIYNLDLILAQNEQSAGSLKNILKNKKSIIRNYGNLKYITTAANLPEARLPLPQNKKIIVFGSSHKGEEEILVQALGGHLFTSLTVLIPRHINRSSNLKKKLSSRAECALLSELKNEIPAALDILIVDAMGLSQYFYSRADIVLIGDTFIKSSGGHNFLEAVQYRKPVIYGQYMISFADITPLFEKQKGVLRTDAANLSAALERLLNEPATCRKMAAQGCRLLKQISADFTAVKKALRDD